MLVLWICAEYLTVHVVLQIITTVTVHHPGGNLRSRDRNVCIYSYLWAVVFFISFLLSMSYTSCYAYHLFIFRDRKLNDQQTKATKWISLQPSSLPKNINCLNVTPLTGMEATHHHSHICILWDHIFNRLTPPSVPTGRNQVLTWWWFLWGKTPKKRPKRKKKSSCFTDHVVQYTDGVNDETLYIWQSKFTYTVFAVM